MYVWNELNNSIYPSLENLKKAFRRADHNDADSRDVRDLMSVLMRVETTSARIAGHILTRRTAVTSFSWSLVSEEKDDVRLDNAKLRLKHAINSILKYRLQASLYGVFALQWNWDTNIRPGEVTPVLFKRYLPVELEKYDDATVYTLKNQDKLEREHEILIADPGDGFSVEIDESYQRGGIMRKLTIDQIILWDNVLEWSNLNRKLKGIIQGILKAFADDAERKAAEKALRELAQENFSMTSDATEYKYNTMADPGAKDSFKEIIEMFNTNAAIALLGQANTSELPDNGGSRAALEVLKKVSADIHYNDIIQCETLCNDLLQKDFRLNHDTKSQVPWKFQINLPEEIDLVERAEFVGSLKQHAIPAKTKEIYSMLSLEQPDGLPEVMFMNDLNNQQP